MASLLSGNCALSREHQTFFLHKGLPTVVRALTRRRLVALSLFLLQKAFNSITQFNSAIHWRKKIDQFQLVNLCTVQVQG
jgi:hypothetical protein